MRYRKPTTFAAALAAAAIAQAGHARAQSVVASWIQLAPGSSPSALANGSYGDQPTSLTPTILARAIVSDGVCPAISVDGGAASAMMLRVSASTLTNTPGTSGATNGKSGYPAYFVSSTATAPANFASGIAKATTSWAECEAVVPAGHKTATVGGTALKLPVAKPRTFLLLADTGCRMNGALASNGSNQQNCSDPTAFPTASLATFEASLKPDVIVHIGDWFYRDTNCLTSGSPTFPGCNDTTSANYETWGDIWDSWNADVFYPMQPLLAAAPIIAARGNHESCGRGARGWYALLDAYPYNFNQVVCAKTNTYPAPNGNAAVYNGDFEPTYVVNTGSINFLVHDSSFANDSAVDTNTAANYDRDLTSVLAALGSGSMNIFTTHKPTFGLVYGSSANAGARPVGVDNGGDFTEQSIFHNGTYAGSAFASGVPANIGLFISGHIHQAQFLNFKDNTTYAPQMIVGMSGSLLDPDMNTGFVPVGNSNAPTYTEPTAPANPAFTTFNQSNVNQYVNQAAGPYLASLRKTSSHDEFGFALLKATFDSNGNIDGFNADVYKVGTTLAGTCRINLKPRSIDCNF
jgi:hypothetical protein